MYVRTDKGKTICPSPLLGGGIKTPVEPRMIKQQARLSTAWGLYGGVSQFCCNDYRQNEQGLFNAERAWLGGPSIKARSEQSHDDVQYPQ